MTRTSFTNLPMNITRFALLAGTLAMTASCEDFLDVNDNPNGPQAVSANLYLPPMLHWMVTDQPFDGRFIGQYVQNWFQPTSGALNQFDRMSGITGASDNGGQTWRDVYWTLGQNLVDMIGKAEAEQRWDLLGVGIMLKGWGWMQLASLHGPIIVKQAIDQTRFTFDYDSEEYALGEARRLLDSAIVLLKRTDGAVDAAYLGRVDKIYGGDRSKWLKYTYGLRALLLNRYSNKATLYNPALVIGSVDSAFANNADDALLPYPATQPTDDRNFWGPARQNLGAFRQTKFVLELMDGTQFGGTVDPRLRRMLVASPDSVYRGLDVNTVFYGALTTAQRPMTLWGYVSTPAANSPSRYLFSDKTRFPAMTYAQLQFVKAEAAFRNGDRPLANTAYLAGINAHFDFVNMQNAEDGKMPSQISAAERAAYLASANINPGAAGLTMTHIMSQKYIAQWAWGFFEQWMDMRRFHYTDTYPGETRQVFPGFAPPTTLYPDNGGNVVQRFRPRYNSEYVWNRAGLDALKNDPAVGKSGLDLDYHTVELWITKP